MPNQPNSALAAMNSAKMQYAGMTESRFRRRRPGVNGVGSPGDSHYQNESAFMKMREYARAMVRDDSTFKFLINRSVTNEIGTGFIYEPDTGDTGADQALKDYWKDWSQDRQQCDRSGRRTFAELEKAVAFAEKVDGDVCVTGTEEGSLQVFEADSLRTPTFAKARKIVHGIEIDGFKKHVAYYFLKDGPDPFGARYTLDKFQAIDAYEIDADGRSWEQVWQIADLHRFSMTRGVTVAHPIFDKAGMYEDIDFALLVKQQFAAFIAFFLERSDTFNSDFQLGTRETGYNADGTTRTLEAIDPGAKILGNKGEKLNLLQANIPSNETMLHLKHTLQIICLNLNLPYCIGLLDGTNETFSSIRFVVDQAKLSWGMTRLRYEAQFHRPVATFRTRRLMHDDPTLARIHGTRNKTTGKKINLFNHWWQKQGWPYPQPLQDANAWAIKLSSGQTSLRDFHAENGGDVTQFIKDTTADNLAWISAAYEAFKTFKSSFPDAVDVTWRDFYNRDYYHGGQMVDTAFDDGASTPTKPAPGKAA